MNALAATVRSKHRRGRIPRDVLLKIGRTLQTEFQPPIELPEWLVRALAELKQVHG